MTQFDDEVRDGYFDEIEEEKELELEGEEYSNETKVLDFS